MDEGMTAIGSGCCFISFLILRFECERSLEVCARVRMYGCMVCQIPPFEAQEFLLGTFACE